MLNYEISHLLQERYNLFPCLTRNDDWGQLDRFILLGSNHIRRDPYRMEPFSMEQHHWIYRLIDQHGEYVIQRLLMLQEHYLCHQPSLTILVAVACTNSHEATRHLSLSLLPKLLPTVAQLCFFTSIVRQLRGWGRQLRRHLALWFETIPVEKLALQAIKYNHRYGWSLRDLIRISHPRTNESCRQMLINWILHPDHPHIAELASRNFRLIQGKLLAFKQEHNPEQLAALIRRYRLPREAIPTSALVHKIIWQSLLPDMPIHAMLRQLSLMTHLGLLTPHSGATHYVNHIIQRINKTPDMLMHPSHLLTAATYYKQGYSYIHQRHWTPISSIIEHLYTKFIESLQYIESTKEIITIIIDHTLYGADINHTPHYQPYLLVTLLQFLSHIEPNIHFFTLTDEYIHPETKQHIQHKLLEKDTSSPAKCCSYSKLALFLLQHPPSQPTIIITSDRASQLYQSTLLHLPTHQTKTDNETINISPIVILSIQGEDAHPTLLIHQQNLLLHGLNRATLTLIHDFIRRTHHANHR